MGHSDEHRAPGDPSAYAREWAALGSLIAGAEKQQVFVPLWQVRPPHQTVTGTWVNPGQRGDDIRTPGGGRPGPGRERIEFDRSDEIVPVEQAMEHYLDMDPDEREDLKARLIRAGILDEDATPSEVANAWRDQVRIAAEYNASRPREKHISPWEAIEKLGVHQEGGKGGRYTGYVGPIDEKRVSKQTYTSSDLSGNAEQILRETLGRGPTKAELAKYTAAVNAAAAKSPVVEHTTGAVDESGNRNTTTTRTGGVDPNQVMVDLARQDPEYAPVQAATTYFEAAMRALNSVV